MMLKRVFDIIVAISSLLILLPVLAVVAVAIYVKMGRPIMFSQIRPGIHGAPFKMFKFRTMLQSTDKTGALLSDEMRLTRFGKFLRSTSLDELPELWNVLKGDMSLVGPRPLLMEYLPLYSAEQARRHEVKPGITGWAQVNGRNALSWDEKFVLDVWYVDNQSIKLDFGILLKTLGEVIFRRNVNRDGHATTPYFKGKKIDD
jgi:lipopolysaccharide/colanic/teichoic acid biosynthesis glycosyltransferase